MTQSRALACLVCAASISAGGCTTIEISGASPLIERRFGLLRIEPADASTAIVIRSRGIGLIPTTDGVTVGYASQSTAYFYSLEQCRIVLFPNTVAQANAFASTLRLAGTTPAGVCEISPKEMP